MKTELYSRLERMNREECKEENEEEQKTKNKFLLNMLEAMLYHLYEYTIYFVLVKFK